MERIDIEVCYIMALVLLSFAIPLMHRILNFIDKKKLSKINTLEDFKKKFRFLILRRWIKPKLGLTNEEIMENLLNEIEKKDNLFNKLRGKPFLIMSCATYLLIFLGLFVQILRYYIAIKFNYIFPVKFPLGETLALICFSLWICFYLTIKLHKYRIEMIHKKLNELKSMKIKDVT